MKTPNTYPLLAVRNAVVFPGVSLPFLVRRSSGVNAIKNAAENGGLILTVTQRANSDGEPKAEEFFNVGTLAKIEKLSGSEEKGYQVILRGISRYKISEVSMQGKHFTAHGEPWADRLDADDATIRMLFQSLKTISLETIDLIPGNTESLTELVNSIEDASRLSYLCAAHMELPIEHKQSLLESVSLKARLLELLDLMQKQKDSLELQTEIQNKMAQKLGKNQREAILREQMRTIREELGEDEDSFASDDLKKKIEESLMPDDVRKLAEQEFKRLEQLGAQSAESQVIRNYLDWLVAMPWGKFSKDDIDLEKAQKILDEDHFGLEKIKRRIIEHLAVMQLKKEVRGSILCFVGPPGVGKTSLGQSIAKALGRQFIRSSLGGVRDEAEIRGHRRTYIGAMPGKIIQSIKRAGEMNPVFMLDEIDKLSHSYHGDPSSALLEVLDPEQNKKFQDHYLDVPFDLSNVFFVATANSLETIPLPLLDRMEIIDLSGYTTAEKVNIAERYLVPKQLSEHGLRTDQVEFSREVISEIATHYTRESGVRGLQRRIGAICRSAAAKVVATKNPDLIVTVDSSLIEDVLGTQRYEPEVSERTLPPGVVTGLAWTPQGGEILFIEAQNMPGHGNLTLTGQLGDVMKESARIALSLVRSKLPHVAPEFDFDKTDLHIHVPSGSVPKDGPSAGIAMMTTIASLFSGRKAPSDLAMTGEITLRGAVTPVGGIKEKIIGAHRAGIKRVILSRKNQKDLKEVPEEVRSSMTFEFVDTAGEVLRLALGIETVDVTIIGGKPGQSDAQQSAVA